MSLKANQQKSLLPSDYPGFSWQTPSYLGSSPFPVIGKWRFRLESTTKNVKVQVKWLLYTGKRPTQVTSQKQKPQKEAHFFWLHFSMGISLVHALFQLAALPKQQVIGDCGNHPQRFLVSAWTAEGKSPPKSESFKAFLRRGFVLFFFPTQIFQTRKHNLKTFAYYIHISSPPPKSLYIQVGLFALQELTPSKVRWKVPSADPRWHDNTPNFQGKKKTFWKFRMNP